MSLPMDNVHTHYQTLKVTEDAPDDVIRAAYLALARRYHPENTPGNHAATSRVPAPIEGSYAVLSDPVKRRDHDAWIASRRINGPTDTAANVPDAPTANGSPRTNTSPQTGRLLGTLRSIVANVCALPLAFVYFAGLRATVSVILLVGFYAFFKIAPPPTGGPYSQTAPDTAVTPLLAAANAASVIGDPFADLPITRTPESAASSDLATAPNGSPWPTSAGYVRGYRVGARGGLSRVTVDNTGNGSAVYVKLVKLGGPTAFPVRHFYIPAYRSLAIRSVLPGEYDVRYRDLSSGALARSESFRLDETPTNDGIRYSSLTLTLYTVRNGNMQTYPLAESEF